MAKKRIKKSKKIEFRNLKNTCYACPAQWEADTNKGKLFIHYRWGYFTVSLDGEKVFSQTRGDHLEGTMSTSRMLEIIKEIGLVPEE